MRKNYLIRLLSLMLFACICSSVFAGKTAYGFVLSSIQVDQAGFYKFDPVKPQAGTTLIQNYKSSGKPQAGAFAEGNYYFFGRGNGAAIVLQKTDLAAQSYTVVGETVVGITFNDMAYDVTTGTMFGVGMEGTVSNLYKIDLTTGTRTVVAALSNKQITLACDNEGQLYSLSATGDLNKLNKETGALQRIAKVNVTFDAVSAQSMYFDQADNTLYWSYTAEDFSKGYIGTVNLATAKVTASEFKYDDQVIGLYIESEPVKEWFGYLSYAGSLGEGVWGMASFDPEDLASVYFIKNAGLTVNSAVYANGTYYAVTHQPTLGDVQRASQLVTLDPVKGDVLTRTDLENSPVFWDLTYDYSTGTTFGISFESGTNHSNLWRMSNNKFEKVVDLGYEYRGLAATLDGELYALTHVGVLHKINKLTGTAQVIGSTGILFDITVSNTMEFDHNSESLYFNCNSYPGNYAILANINREDGSVIKSDTFPDRNMFLGLYIPFERSNTVPASVTDFTVTPAANGELKATLKWKNPAATAGGSALSAITKVEIIRDGTVLTTLTDQTPGADATWTDNAPVHGFNNYVIKVYNNEGAGEVASSFWFIGKDVPAAPSSVKLVVKDATKMTLTWEVPQKGLNTGWFDKANLKYDIVRLPDNIKVATGLSALKFEEELTTMNYYSYVVTANTPEGVGGSAKSNAEIGGLSMPVPYECRFLTETESGLWVLDEKGWKIDYLGLGEQYRGLIVPYTRETMNKASDTWAYSPLISLEKGKSYKLTFAARCMIETFFESLKVCVGKEKTVAAQTQTIIDLPEIPGLPVDFENMENSLNHYEASFSVSESGLYSMGFYCYSPADKKDNMQLTSIKLVEGNSIIDNETSVSINVFVQNGRLYLEGEYTSAVVYNQLGAVVYDIPEVTGSINTHLVSGVYFVKIMNGNNASTYKIFIK